MTSRAWTASTLAVVVLGLNGCGNPGSPQSPVMPSSGQVTPFPIAETSRLVPRVFPPAGHTLSDVTLSGWVFEETPTGRAPIDLVEIYCDVCTPATHGYALTDSKGFYSFRGVWLAHTGLPVSISLGKKGFDDPPGVPPSTPPNITDPGWREVVVNGDTRLDLQLVRR